MKWSTSFDRYPFLKVGPWILFSFRLAAFYWRIQVNLIHINRTIDITRTIYLPKPMKMVTRSANEIQGARGSFSEFDSSVFSLRSGESERQFIFRQTLV
jgi:hypothetical protein